MDFGFWNSDTTALRMYIGHPYYDTPFIFDMISGKMGIGTTNLTSALTIDTDGLLGDAARRMIKMIPGDSQGRVYISSSVDFLDFVKTNSIGMFVDYLNISAKRGNFYGDVVVNGKITSTGGYDPPYVGFTMESRKAIIERVSKEIPPEKMEQAIQFWNSETSQMEIYLPTEGEFRDFSGNILDKKTEYVINK